MTATRPVRLLTVAAVAALSQWATPVAQAVSPPAIDDRWLPRPAAPAPPWPTVQREGCVPMPADTPPAGHGLAGSPELPRAWQLTRGAGQRVAVIDTGVARHRGLPDVVAGGDFVSTGDGTQDCDAHETLVAGVVAATAPDATVVSIRQSSARFAPASGPSRAGVGDVDTLSRAVRTAADLGASVINVSSVACAAAGLDDRALGAALAYAVDVKNAVVVAPAGDTGGSAPCPPQRPGATWETVTVAVSPAWYDDYVLAVGSVGADGTPSAFTLAGPWVDVAAPGEGVTPLGSPPVSGTSYAAPMVSGLAALIRARFPTLTARQVMRRIESTAHRTPTGRDPLVGHGTVDAVAAVSTGSPPPAATSTPAPVPITSAAPPGPPDPAPRRVALRGAGVCLLVLLAGAGARRLRRPRAGVPRD